MNTSSPSRPSLCGRHANYALREFPYPARVAVLALASALALAAPQARADAEAQLVYRNGTVLTMDAQDRMAQAVAVRDGKILAVGQNEDVGRLIGAGTRVVDLAGKTLIPGIYDAHSHLSLTGIWGMFDANLNSPPIGSVKTMDDLLALLRAQQTKVGANAWVTGMGYDDSLLSEKRHPTRADLDQVSATQPIVITHISGHFAVANSAALAVAGITAQTPNPEGGVIRRDAQGEPNGVLEETALYKVTQRRPALSDEQLQQALRYASRMYAERGVTTANDGASRPVNMRALESLARAGELPVRVVAWPMLETMKEIDQIEFKSGRIKIGGIKDFADGSIQGYTGYLSQPYHTPHHGDEGYKGFPRQDREKLAERVKTVYQAGRQSLIHANGDEAISDVLYAFRKAQEAYPRKDARPVVIHSQMAREDELDEMKALGAIPSFFVLHTYYWGDRHRDVFIGPERASRISPTRSALERGMRFTLHTDTPIVPMEPMRLIWSAVNRTSTSGATIGAAQRITPMQALRATTIDAAYENFEEQTRGSIEPGKWADLVVLSDNPTTIDPQSIKDIRVLETVLEGQSVYRAPQ
ncbi:MAG: amidohydrolase [Proteobacteria bacterium]|nr:amidohydrolase [Pseudomonadota bacterium]